MVKAAATKTMPRIKNTEGPADNSAATEPMIHPILASTQSLLDRWEAAARKPRGKSMGTFKGEWDERISSAILRFKG